ncbi:transcriptional regulator [Microtetraspora sp. NBRC 13810]|uniref:transcriptional regulator n=1 Tax=Microtetraspora sp. NBRC 13810 TaxID=3030990 RepID=UPI002556C808|nr:transcriptional regulator [Microtetraspora sp. NBRC 13810]
MLAAHARHGRARALEGQGKIGPAVEAFERLRREAAAHPERLADLPLTVALSRCYQRAGDSLRARDLGGHALRQVARLALTHGEIAVDLASALVEAAGVHPQQNSALSYVRQVLADNGVPPAVDREAEVHALWRASVTAAQGEDSALAVRLADDALATGRPARMAVRLARIAMDWSRLAVTGSGTLHIDEARGYATAATEIFAVFPAATREHAASLIVLAQVQFKGHKPAEAAKLAASSLDVLSGAASATAAHAHLVLARVALAQGEGDVPVALRRARDILDTVTSPEEHDRQVARAWRELGDLYGETGAEDDQAAAYRKALETVGVRSVLNGVAMDTAVLTR